MKELVMDVSSYPWQSLDLVPRNERVIIYVPDHPKGKAHEVRTAMFPTNYPVENVQCRGWMPLVDWLLLHPGMDRGTVNQAD